MVFLRYYFEGAEEHRIKLMPDGSSKTEWLCDTLFKDIQEHHFKDEEQCGGHRYGLKRVVQETESGRTRALQFCWTATAE